MTGTGLFMQLRDSLVTEYANRDHWIPAAWLHPAGRPRSRWRIAGKSTWIRLPITQQCWMSSILVAINVPLGGPSLE